MLARICVVFALILQGINAENYGAAVLEHASVTGTTPQNTILENLEIYRTYTQQAITQSADIIVFPEYGLTTFVSDPEEYAIEIPDNSSSATFQNKILTELSALAVEHNIYLVVNLLEKSNSTDNDTLYYNTNVVLNRDGNIIAKYRKINLYNEPKLMPGNETVTFTTDFGVTFGIFTCFDILFQNPARDIFLNQTVTDVVFPIAWFSGLPFYQSLSIQYGYSVSNGVNLLAANYNKPKDGNGGSGIYLANGNIADMFIDGSHSSKLIVQRVDKISSRVNNETCDTSNTASFYASPRGLFDKKNISDYITKQIFDSSDFNFKNIDLTESQSSQQICYDDFCCTFNISVASANISENFKIAAFDGFVEFDTVGEQHVRICSLLFCENDKASSCVTRFSPTTIFSKISINGKLPNYNTSFYQPVTLTAELHPITDIVYCSNTTDNGDTSNIQLATVTQQSKVLVFGLYGRTSSATNIYHINLSFGFILVIVKYFVF